MQQGADEKAKTLKFKKDPFKIQVETLGCLMRCKYNFIIIIYIVYRISRQINVFYSKLQNISSKLFNF
jgi:hypothetical protein